MNKFATRLFILLALAFVLALPTTGAATNAKASERIKAGDEELQKKDLQGALSSYARAIEFDPRSTEAYIRRGIVFRLQGFFERAVDDFTTALGINEDYDAYYNRALTHSDLGNNTDAIKDYTSAIRLDPENVISYNNRGIVYAKTNRFAEAINDFSKAIEIDPKNAFAYNNRASAYSDTAKFEEALKDLRKLSEINTGSLIPHFDMARIHAFKGNTAEACKNLKKARELGLSDMGIVSADPIFSNFIKSPCFKELSNTK